MEKNVRQQNVVYLFDILKKQISMEDFDDRLKFQKILFLAQHYGIDFGYTFSWYLKGPYSKVVSKDGYSIQEQMSTQGTLLSISKTTVDKEMITKLVDLIKPFSNDPEWLEIASSIIYLKKETYKEESLERIIGFLIEDLTSGYKNFEEEKVRKIIADLIRLKLLN